MADNITTRHPMAFRVYPPSPVTYSSPPPDGPESIMSKSGYTCVRYIFCYLNVLLWLSGCGLLGLGVWLRVSHEGETTMLPQYSAIGADSILIASGGAIFIITFFACCGSWFQSRCMLITYFALVIIMFVLEFMLATLAFVYRENLSETVRDELREGIRLHFRNPPDNGLEEMWDQIHTKFHCCGVNNYEDWYDIAAWPGKRNVPESCCLPKFHNNTECRSESDQDKWYNKGCSEEVLMWFVSQLHIVGIVGLVVSFIQLFGLISAMLLFCTVRHKRAKDPQRGKYTAYSPTM